MRKITLAVLAGVTALAILFALGCSSDDPCKEYDQKVMDCLKASCSGKSGCSVCSCVDQSCCQGYACTTSETTCEGTIKDNASQQLSGFSCDTNDAANTFKSAVEATCP